MVTHAEETNEDFSPTEAQLLAAMKAVLEMCTPEEKTQLLEGLLERAKDW